MPRTAPHAAPPPTSLEALETTGWAPRIGTASQRKLHQRWWGVRDRILTALENSADDTLTKRAQRLDGCCSAPLLGKGSNGEVSLQLQACRDRLCPRCQQHRGRQASTRIAALVSGWPSCRFATLTLLHRPGSLADELTRLHEAFRRLRKTPEWRARVNAGVWSIEVTRNPGTARWHAHVHLLYRGEFFPQKLLSELWKAATGDSMIVDVRAVPDREQTARYIADYVSKPADVERWSQEEICEYAAAMHGRRLLHTFGNAHGANVDPPEDTGPQAPAEFVAPIRHLIHAARSGDEEAKHAIEILRRLSGTAAAAAGADPIAKDAPHVPVEQWEHAIVLAAAKRCFDAFITAELASLAPPPAPRRAERPRAEMLIDVSRHR